MSIGDREPCHPAGCYCVFDAGSDFGLVTQLPALR